jgi:hypothetical protein
MVIILALATLIMIPLVTAENPTNNSGTGPIVNDNGTVTINGVTLPLITSKELPLNTTEVDHPLTREQFFAVNWQYIEYLTEHFGKERAEQMVNAEYDRHPNSTSRVDSIPDRYDILSIDPVGDHVVGDVFLIHGVAILPAGTELPISIYGGSFNPGIPPQSDPWYDHIPTSVRVKYNNKNLNVWSYEVNTTGSYPDEYFISLKYPGDSTINASAIFNLTSPGTIATGNPYMIIIDPIRPHARNESFPISGTTNLPSGDELLVEVFSLNHTLVPKGTDQSGAVGVVNVQKGSQGNIWSFTINPPDLKPDDYKIIVTSYRYGTNNDTSFTVHSEQSGSLSSNIPASGVNAENSRNRALPIPTGIVIGSLVCAAFLIARRCKQ